MMQHATDPDLIRRRAYDLWLQRGCPAGSPEHDWLTAERELRETVLGAPSPKPYAAPAPVAGAAREEAPSPTVPRPRRTRAIVTKSGAAPAAQLLSALTPTTGGVREVKPRAAAGAKRRAK